MDASLAAIDRWLISLNRSTRLNPIKSLRRSSRNSLTGSLRRHTKRITQAIGQGTRPRRPMRVETLESRQMLSADGAFGATSLDTGEYLLGSVTVTPVFFDSDGSIDQKTENWTEGEIDAILDEKVRPSLQWWSDLLATVTDKHSLSFTIDETYADNPVTTGYEPIDRSSNTFQRYVGDWLTDLGYGDAPSIERAVNQFNDAQRQAHGTDWAFTIFIVDSSDDDDGFFASGGFSGAFAYPGGLFYIVPSGRPVSTYTHEMGHIFWARDEYPGAGSWTDQRGYYNAQNFNASDNPTPGWVQQDSIMRGGVAAQRAFDNLVTVPSTLELIGWRDSDGDGVFDVLDVPIQIDAAGYFDAQSSTYTFAGSATVDTLANENSSGTQSDITLARVREIQYRIEDGAGFGDWETALLTDDTHVDFQYQFSVTSPFSSIQWRAIDTATGVTSEVVSGTNRSHAFSGNGGGFFFDDLNDNGVPDAGENFLGGIQVALTHQNGSHLLQQSTSAGEVPDSVVGQVGELSFSAEGITLDGRVGSFRSGDLAGQYVFHSWDDQTSSWKEYWSDQRKLVVSSSQDVGRVVVDFAATDNGGYGIEEGSFARIEAYDRNGDRIERVTSEMVAAEQSGQLVIEDSNGRIASVKIYGHAETDIQVTAVEFGDSYQFVSDAGGAWQLDGLADGVYSVEYLADRITTQFNGPTTITVTDGKTNTAAVAVTEGDSPRHNIALPGDANDDGMIAARDALLVINDLARFGSRVLSVDESIGPFIDVNNDGEVSAIDALRVINLLQRQAEGAQSEGESVSAQTIGSPPAGESSDDPPQVARTSSSDGLNPRSVDAVFFNQPSGSGPVSDSAEINLHASNSVTAEGEGLPTPNQADPHSSDRRGRDTHPTTPFGQNQQPELGNEQKITADEVDSTLEILSETERFPFFI